MTARALLLFLLLVGCAPPDDDSCEDGDARCEGDRSIAYCDAGVWQEAEACAPREGAGGLTINTVCYPEQGICAP